MRILVVDDNADGANALARLLRLWGYEADVALDGPQALQQVHDQPPDIVLLDLALPGMDGYQIAKRIREQMAMRTFRLAALTGHGQEHYRLRFLQEGFHGHFVKPIDLLELQEWLENEAQA